MVILLRCSLEIKIIAHCDIFGWSEIYTTNIKIYRQTTLLFWRPSKWYLTIFGPEKSGRLWLTKEKTKYKTNFNKYFLVFVIVIYQTQL